MLNDDERKGDFMRKICHLKKLVLITLMFALIFALTSCQTEVVDTDDVNLEQSSLIEENLEEWFAGEELHKYAGSNKAYDWYIDQGDTGEHSFVNCGPSSTVMAMKWLEKDYEETVEEAREEQLMSGGWWYTSNISQYFDDRDVEYSHMMLELGDMEKAIEDLKGVIDDEKIAILCVDMGYIAKESDASLRINRFYDYDDGHFLIVKGYAEIDDVVYFEMYDPNTWGMVYEDETPMGKDRYYLAEELIDAAVNWYEFAIVIE